MKKITIRFNLRELLKMLFLELSGKDWSVTVTDRGWNSGTNGTTEEQIKNYI